uniref:Nucleosome-remodeling factor subunit BPTF-like n=1 Tax=Gouania willdenowi TaxID=441366 RepID=A0A8C5GMS8_GOUWI
MGKLGSTFTLADRVFACCCSLTLLLGLLFSTGESREEKWRLQATQSGTPAIQFEPSPQKLRPGLRGDTPGTVAQPVGAFLPRFSPVCVAPPGTEIEAEQTPLSSTMRGRRGRPPKPAAVMREASPGPAGGSRGGRTRMRGRGRARGRVRGRGLSGGDCGSGSPEVDAEISGRENFNSSRGRRKVGSSGTVATSRGRGGRGRGRGSRGGRGARGGVRRPQTKVVYDDNSDEEDDHFSYRSDEDELLNDNHSTDLEEDEALGNDSDFLDDLPEYNDYDNDDDGGVGDDDDASYCTESSFRSHSTLGSTPGRKKSRPLRPQSPIIEAKDIPPLELPKSSEDLLVTTSQLLNVSAVYEVLRNFGTVLRLSPFRFEDFCAALASQEQCTLLAETHIALLKAILREEDTSNTTFGPADVKDSVNSTLYFVDGMTWPEVVRAYCESDPEYRHILPFQEAEEYPYEPLESKIKVLQFLVDQFLATNIAREELMSEGVVAYDDHCRVCHRLGDLLCCETCSAVYHLECVKPPLQEVPEDEWQCEVCVAHKVPGVVDCIPEAQKTKPFIRQLPIGYDRHRRKYWFLNRRIVVEEDGEQEDKTIWYYSTKVQLAELIECLDKNAWEAELYAAIEELRDEVHTHMDITEDLTNKARGNNKCFLTVANDEILERLRAKKEEEMEEVKRRAAEEAMRARLEMENRDVDVENENEKVPMTDVGQQEGQLNYLTPKEDEDLIKEELTKQENDSIKTEGDSRDSINGEMTGLGSKKSLATRMVTRLRNPESKLSQMKSQQFAAAVHEANKGFKEGKEVLVVNAQGDITRVSTRSSKEVVMKGPVCQYFKLGQEGKYRVYHNQYSSNALALNKHQHREDHDKRRHLSHKFCMTAAGEFKWNGSIHGSKLLTISTLRLNIIQLENNVPGPFMHPNWASHRTNWIKAVQMCSKAREFALALAILECAIKPVAMLPVWKDSLGHTRFNRMTSMEREEKEKVKKRERKLEEEETLQQATWVKYTFPIKHQVWKQKGEEYRVTGYGGWSWISKTYVQRFVPRLPGNTNANYRKELEVGDPNSKENDEDCSSLKNNVELSLCPVNKSFILSSGSIELQEKLSLKEEPLEILDRPFYFDVVDVSKGFLNRIAYKKKVNPSKLDILLERRVKQHIFEERQQASAPKLQSPAPVTCTFTPVPGTPKRPRSPLKPHSLIQMELTQGESLTVEQKCPPAQTAGTGEVEGQEVKEESKASLSQSINFSTSSSHLSSCQPKDSSVSKESDSAHDPDTSGPQEAEQNSPVRTLQPQDNGSDYVRQEGIKLPDLQETPAEGLHCSLEQQLFCPTSNMDNVANIENTGFNRCITKLDSVQTFSKVVDQKSMSESKPIQQNSETSSLKRSDTEENGMEPEEKLENMPGIKYGRTSCDVTPNPVTPLPQVNGNDGPVSEWTLNNSLMSQNNSVLKSMVNNVGKVEEQGMDEPFKEGTVQKPLVNGDLAPVNCSKGWEQEPSLVSKAEMDQKVILPDQDYTPAVKKKKMENNTDLFEGNAQHNTRPAIKSTETTPTSGVKIIRMAPSPIPSAEESSLSDEFTEDNSNSGSAQPLTPIVTQETNISTTTVVSNKVTTAQVPSSGNVTSAPASTADSSAVPNPTTMTKTTVSGQSQDRQSETVMQDEKTTLSVSESTTDSSAGTMKSSVAVSHEESLSSTKGRVRLLNLSCTKKTRSDTALPSYCKFVTKSNRKSIFVLQHDDLKVLARKGGFREVAIFSYNAKPALDIWPYPSPRPTFGITWRYRLQTVKSLAGVSLMLRLLWASLRWDDMAVKPSAAVGTTRTETSDTEITTTEIIKRRDVGPYGIRSEYCIRKIICPLGVPETPKETHTPQRKGLRSSALRPKKPEPAKQTGPVVIETWVAEEELDLWEIRAFSERVEKEKAQAAEQAKKRLEQKPGLVTGTPTGSPATPIATPKVIVGSISGQGTSGTKVVLSTKMGTPVTFQQNKNFQQSFATWVKQGQSLSTETTVGTSGGHTLQITGTSVGGKVVTTKLPLPANSKIVTVNVPSSQGGGFQQKVLGIIPSSTAGGAQTFTTFQPRATTLNIRPNTPGSQQQYHCGGQIRPGMTVIRTPIQQTGAMGKTILRTPLMVQQGSQGGHQVVTQIIRGQAVSTSISAASPVATVTGQGGASPNAAGQTAGQTPPGTPRAPGQGQVKLTMAQLAQLTQAGVGGAQQALTVMVQGQGQTTGQLQIIPPGVTVIPGPGQQLMQASLPNGQVQRFLFTSLASAATTTSSLGENGSLRRGDCAQNAIKLTQDLCNNTLSKPDFVFCHLLFSAATPPSQTNSTSTNSTVQPAQQATAPSPAGPQVQIPAQTSIQSPTSLQVKTQGGQIPGQTPQLISMTGLQQQVQQVLAQLQAQQGGGSLPQHIKLQLPIQIQQSGTTSAQGGQIGNVVTIQAASVQEQLLRIQQLREQQQQKKRQAAEAKRELALSSASQSDIIQKQVVMKQNAAIEHLKQKKTMTPAEREENQVCNHSLMMMMMMISSWIGDKDERQEAKRKKKEEVLEAKRRLANASKLSSLLYRHKESLKMEILKKRALLDKDFLSNGVQEELKKDLLRMRREKEKAQAAAQAAAAARSQQQQTVTHTHGITSQHHHATTVSSSHKTKREQEKETATSAKSKKKKMISTTCTKESKKDTNLYCICKTPYDETK